MRMKAASPWLSSDRRIEMLSEDPCTLTAGVVSDDDTIRIEVEVAGLEHTQLRAARAERRIEVPPGIYRCHPDAAAC